MRGPLCFFSVTNTEQKNALSGPGSGNRIAVQLLVHKSFHILEFRFAEGFDVGSGSKFPFRGKDQLVRAHQLPVARSGLISQGSIALA